MIKFWQLIKTQFLTAFPVIGSFAAVLIILVVASCLSRTADDSIIRYSGLMLQILGIITVGLGLRNRRVLFGRSSLAGYLQAWFIRWVKAPSISLSASPTSGDSMRVKLSVWRGVPSDAPIDTRLAALEANLEILKAEQADIYKEFREETRKQIKALDSECQLRESDIRKIQTLVDTLGAGGLHLEAVGLFWLIAGVVFGAIPAEIWWLVRRFMTEFFG